MIDDINTFLNTPGVAPTKQADEKCGDKDCYHVTLNLTSAQLNDATGGALASAAPTASGTADVWFQKTDLRPAKLTIAGNAGAQGTLSLTMTLSNYDAAVTVTAPADLDVAPASS